MGEIVRDLSPESLARANEVNLAEGLAACARVYGGEVLEAPDLFWCHAGIPLSGFNRILRARLTPETMDVRIEWVIGRARELHFPFLWDIDPWTQPADLGDRLVRHGFTDRGDEPAMGVVLANLPGALPLPDGVTVERVKDHATLEIWARTMSAGFGSPDPAADPVIAAVTRDSFSDDAAAHYYLARLHSDPVATSGLTRAGGVAGIFAVTTIESARRRGIGAAVTMAPLLDARSDGYEVGVLQASEMGYPVYAAIGFTEQFRYHEYVWRSD